MPGYGSRSLADVTTSLLAALGTPGFANPLALPRVRGVALLLLDGLGARQLAEHPADAPTLTALAAGAGEPVTVGFPATTATSVAALGTGRPPGEHGIVGYTFCCGEGVLLNALGWQVHGAPETVDLRERLPPERVQPEPTALERAAAAGVTVRIVAPRLQRDSGLTRAVLRGGTFRGVDALGDLAAEVLDALAGPAPVFCYAYHGDLDLLGHVHGPGSLPWRLQLAQLDALVSALLDRLPPGTLLAVTGDHGILTLTERVDADETMALTDGVALLGGEARARHVYAEPGAASDVLAAWRETLGERAWVLAREEAVVAGWFGPVVHPGVVGRIGDVVVAMRGTAGVVRGRVESKLSRLVGHHGSLTPEEQLVPLLLAGGGPGVLGG